MLKKLSIATFVVLITLAAVACGLYIRSFKETSSDNMQTRSKVFFDCGQWAVLRSGELLGIPLTQKRVLEVIPLRENGNSLQEISQSLRSFGLTTEGRSMPFDAFMAATGIRVVHLHSPDHFVVVIDATTDRVRLFDNDGRHQLVSSTVLRKRWSGNVLNVNRATAVSETSPANGSNVEKKPMLRFETLFIDKGDIPITTLQQRVEYPFTIRNCGSADLIIHKIHTDCSCFKATKIDRVPPGGSDVIRLEYLVDSRKRSFIHEAVVETNDPTHPSVLLRASGNTDTLVSVYPPRLDFGEIPVGHKKHMFLFIHHSGDKSLSLNSIVCSLPGVRIIRRDTIDSELLELLWPKAHKMPKFSHTPYIFEVIYDRPETVQGEAQGEIEIQTNIEHFEKLTVPVEVKILSLVASAPSFINFGEFWDQRTASASISLYTRTKQPFTITKIGPSIEGFTWSVKGDERSDHKTIRFEILGSNLHPVIDTDVQIHIESNGVPSILTIPIRGFRAGLRDVTENVK